MSSLDDKWSVLKYDFKTVLDILRLPCLVKIESTCYKDTRGQLKILNHQLNQGLEVKFEKEIGIHFVRARVLDFQDPDWYDFTKGEEFTQAHRKFVGKEVLVPLEYGGKIRLDERTGGKEYFNIREVVEDFPRFVRVDRDVVCLSPGNTNTCQIVKKGTILELDRVTRGARAVRGAREGYLICQDTDQCRELAFRVMSPIHFTKLSDPTKYTIKEFVEHLPLPQSVQFVDINPYVVVSGIDEEAKDLLVMLSGPIELLDIKMVKLIFGVVSNDATKTGSHKPYCDIFAIPIDEDVIANTSVYMLKECLKDNASQALSEQLDSFDLREDPIQCNIMKKKLYFLNTNEHKPVALRFSEVDNNPYKIDQLPDTPPLPPKRDHTLMKGTLSAPSVKSDEADNNTEGSKKCHSTGDMAPTGSFESIEGTDFVPRGFKNYFSRLSRRVKNNSSYIRARLGSDRQGKLDGSKSFHGSSKTPKALINNTSITNKQSGFICYLNELDDSNYVQLESSDNDVNENIEEVEEINRNKTQEGTKTNPTSNINEAVYVDVSRIRSLKSERSTAKCLICRSNYCR